LTDITDSSVSDKGFFGSLFEFSFSHFIALKFIKVIYAIATVVIILGTLLFMVSAINQGGAYVVLGVIVAPIVGLLYLVFTRIGFEVIAVLFRIGQNTSVLVSYGPPQLTLPQPPAIEETPPPPSPRPRARKPRSEPPKA
jgi:hypothetical protein